MAAAPQRINLVHAVELATQAIKEDNNRNYPEALRLYEESVENLLCAMKYEAKGVVVKDAICAKCLEYVSRAEKIVEFLKKEGNMIPIKQFESTSNVKLTTTVNLQKAIQLVTKATEADRNKNYVEALRLYNQSEEYFNYAMKYEAIGKKSKEAIRAKSELYMDRARKIVEFLKKEANKKPDKKNKSGSNA